MFNNDSSDYSVSDNKKVKKSPRRKTEPGKKSPVKTPDRYTPSRRKRK